MSKINQAGYDEWAHTYDTELNSTIYVDEINFPLHFLGLPIGNVLEVGCGTGRHTLKLAEAGHEVSAIDLSDQMLQIATTKLSGRANVNFFCGDLLDTAFLASTQIANGGFDLAIMSLVLEHIENPKEVFSIVADLLAPNGQFLVSDIHHERMQNGSGARYIDPLTLQEKRMESYVHLPADIKTAAQNAGLEVFQYTTIYGTSALAKIAPAWVKYRGVAMIDIWGFSKTNGKIK